MHGAPAARPRRPSLCRDRARSPRTRATRRPAPGAVRESSPPSGTRARCSAGRSARVSQLVQYPWETVSTLRHGVRPDRCRPRSCRPAGAPPVWCARRA